MHIRHAIGFVVASLSIIGSANAQPVSTHSYDLNGTLADGQGGPALALRGNATVGASGVMFDANHSGLSLANAATVLGSSDTYSVELYFRFANVAGYNRVLNSNGTDNGLYIHNGYEDYYQNDDGYDHPGSVAFTRDVMHHLVFARGPLGASVYIDGQLGLGTKPYASSLLSGALDFFADDTTEASSGYVDFIRFYDQRLSAADVTTLYNGGSPLATAALAPAVPEPASWAMMIGGIGLVGGAVRRRARRRGTITASAGR